MHRHCTFVIHDGAVESKATQIVFDGCIGAYHQLLNSALIITIMSLYTIDNSSDVTTRHSTTKQDG